MNTFPRALRASRPGMALVLAAGALFAQALHAESLSVRDPDGTRWQVIENPDEDEDDYVLQRLGPDRKPDARYGKQGSTEFQLGTDNDAPTSLRVDAATHRGWVGGATVSGGRVHAVVMRFGPDGNVDPRWGVQGRVDASPSGLAIRVKDVLPLEDGSVLAAGEEGSGASSRAVVFHLKADGSVDLSFGSGGVWLRPGAEQATATSLAVATNGGVAAAVLVRGASAQGEVWSLDKGVPKKLGAQPLDEGVDEDEVRIDYIGERWNWVASGGPTLPVPAATLTPRPMPVASTSPAATSEPGNVAYNPFVETQRSAAPSKAHDDDGVPWIWIGVAAMLALGLTALFFKRTPAASPPRQNARR